MPLQRQTIEIVFEGLEQKTGSITTKPGRLRTAENVEFDKHGVLNKRRGYELIPMDTAVDDETFDVENRFMSVATHDGNLVIYGMDHFYEVVTPDDNANASSVTRRGPTMRGAFQTHHVVTAGGVFE